jgi:DNA-binding transcriptional ArsR family regulator
VLFLLLLLAPAVAAAGEHGSGGASAGGPSTGQARGDGAGMADGGPRTGGAGAPSASTPHGVPGAGDAPTDAGETHGVLAASSRQVHEASAVIADGSALDGGRAYRTGTDRGATGREGGPATRQPLPEVSRAPGRQFSVQSETTGLRAPRAVPGGSATGRAEGSGAAGPHDGGRHAPWSATNPVPYAAPTRSGHEQDRPDPGTQGTPGGRGRKDAPGVPAPVTDAAETPDPVLLFRFLLVLGFRRVRPENVLEHRVRRDLHAAIRANPGLDLAGCASATGANRETLRYHLALLVCFGKVVEETRAGSVRYFPHDPALTPVRRALLHDLKNESLAPMLEAIRTAPGISRGELAERLGVTGPSVTRQVQRLVEDHLVESERCGRSTCYRLTTECADGFGWAFAAKRDRGAAPDRASA